MDRLTDTLTSGSWRGDGALYGWHHRSGEYLWRAVWVTAVVRNRWDAVVKTAEAIKEAVGADVVSFVGEAEIYDEITLVILKQS